MLERSIVLRAWEVRAVLKGQKTQLRRPVAPQPGCLDRDDVYGDLYNKGPTWSFWLPDGRMTEPRTWPCPFGAVGDKLWVREKWQAVHFSKDFESGYCDNWWEAEKIPEGPDFYWSLLYAERDFEGESREERGFPWRSPLHMPRWASRLTLAVTDIRLERLQDISEEDVQAEGCTGSPFGPSADRMLYPTLWDSTNTKHPWTSNPWIWCVTFKGEPKETRPQPKSLGEALRNLR